MPKISVLMPVYNAENFLEESVNSILGQTYKDFELLLLEDGSKDNSLQLANELAKKDSRIKVYPNEQNMGIVKTLNRGIEHAQGEYIARMDSDDFSFPTRFEEQVKFMEEHKDVAVCGTWVETFGNNSGNIWKLATESELMKVTLLFYGVLCHPAVMIRKELVFGKLGLRYEGYFSEDYLLWVKIAQKSKLANIPKVLIKYRTHENSLMALNAQANNDVTNSVRLMQLKNLGIDPTEEEFKIHQQIGSWNFENSYEFLLNSKEWFKKLIIANKTAKYFDQTTFIKFLNTKLLDEYNGIKVKYTKGIFKLFFWDLSSGLNFLDRLSILFKWKLAFLKKVF